MQAKTLIAILTLSTLAACGKEEAPTPEEQAPAPIVDAPATPEAAPAAPMADAGGNEHGRIKYGSICAGCHGKKGEGQGIFPKVAGQSADVLAAKLRDYKAGKKLGEQTAMMAPNAQNLSEEDIDALASYMAGLGG